MNEESSTVSCYAVDFLQDQGLLSLSSLDPIVFPGDACVCAGERKS